MQIDQTDYKAAVIQGKQRVYGGKFGNELGGTPWISFEEELITLDGATGNVYRNPVGGCTVSLTDPSKVLELRSPIDDSVIGTTTYQDMFVMMYSLGRQAQIERDAALVTQ